jgi:exodeoxyribonuclease VII large subunit
VTLTHAADARAARLLTLRFGDGSLDAVVEGEKAPVAVERKARRSYISSQPGLFDPQED